MKEHQKSTKKSINKSTKQINQYIFFIKHLEAKKRLLRWHPKVVGASLPPHWIFVCFHFLPMFGLFLLTFLLTIFCAFSSVLCPLHLIRKPTRKIDKKQTCTTTLPNKVPTCSTNVPKLFEIVPKMFQMLTFM